MFLPKLLTLGLKKGLELGLRSSLVGLGLLELLKFTIPGGGGIQTFLGECGGFGGESFVDPDLDGVQGLGVTSSGRSDVQAALLDVESQVGGGAGLSSLASDEGGGSQTVLPAEQLVLEITSAEAGQGVVVGGAGDGGGYHRGEVVLGWAALATTTRWTLSHLEHRSGDESLEVRLEEPGETSEMHGLGDSFHPSSGAVGEEGILGVRRRHTGAEFVYLVKYIKIPIKCEFSAGKNRACSGSVVLGVRCERVRVRV